MLRLHAGRLPVLNTDAIHVLILAFFCIFSVFISIRPAQQRVLDRSIWREGSLQTPMLCEAGAYVPADDDK